MMVRVGNPLMMIMPPELMGMTIAGLLVLGGLALAVGARRTGWSMVALALALPLIGVMAEALINDLFLFLPEALVMPTVYALMAFSWLALCWALIKLLFGQKAVDEARGQLLADAVKAILRSLFTKQAMGLIMAGIAVAHFFG